MPGVREALSFKRRHLFSDVGCVELLEVFISPGADQISVLEVLDAQVVACKVNIFAEPDLD